MEQTELHNTLTEILVFIMELIPVGVTIGFLWYMMRDLFKPKK